MPGFILDTGTLTPTGNTFTIDFDPLALHQEFPNLDLKAKDAIWPGLSDPVLISFLLSGDHAGERVHRAGALFLNGDEAHPMASAQLYSVYLPASMRNR
jgi:hypothetical protein